MYRAIVSLPGRVRDWQRRNEPRRIAFANTITATYRHRHGYMRDSWELLDLSRRDGLLITVYFTNEDSAIDAQRAMDEVIKQAHVDYEQAHDIIEGL